MALVSVFGTREHINARAWESSRACDEMRSAIQARVSHAHQGRLPRPRSVGRVRWAAAGLCQCVAQRRLAGPLLVAGHHRCHMRRAGPPHGAGDCAPRLRRQSHHVPPLGVHHDRPLQPCFFGVPNQSITTAYDARTDAAIARHVSTLPPTVAHFLLSGMEDAMQDLPTPSFRHARGITPDDVDGDDEHPLAQERMKIQALNTTCVDTSVQQGLLQMHGQDGSWGPARGCRNLGTPRLITRGCGA